MKLSRTWQGRIDGMGARARLFGTPVVVALAAIAGLNVLWGWMFGAPPDIAGPARTVVNKAAVVGSYAQNCVTVWLTATISSADSVARCAPVRASDLPLPSTPAWVIDGQAVIAVTFEGYGGEAADAEVYSVVVGVTQRPYESAAPETVAYRMPVLWSKFGPRGADLPLPYPSSLSATDPAFVAASGFLTAYLTTAGGVDRYVSADSMLTGLGGAYESVTVTSVLAASAPPAVPADDQTVRVRVRVDAVTAQYAPVQMVYPLTLRGLDGRWLVAGIDAVPLVSLRDELVPVVAGGP